MSSRHPSESEWVASLPVELVFTILDFLFEPIDHVHFAAVCKLWRSLSQHYICSRHRWPKLLPPMLMIPNTCNTIKPVGVLYSLSAGKLYEKINLRCRMPGFLMSRRYNGCGHGWLAAIDHLQPYSVANLHLLNPFKNVVYPLNGIGWSLGMRSKPKGAPKLILYGDPTLKGDNSFMVVVFYINGSRIAFTRGVQHFWTCIRSIEEYSITDAVFYRGQVYAVETNFGRIVSFDVTSCCDGQPQWAKTHYTPDMCSSSRSYLVESTNGELLHVRRFLKLQRQWDQLTMPVTHTFKVYKLVFDENGSIVQQLELKTIGDETLFVGDTQSMSVLASSFAWCKPNSIYYTSDSITVDEYLNFNGYNINGIQCDIGIFNLEQGAATPIPWPPRNSEYEYRSQPPIWILPPINGLR